jgi:hypothetical protein
VYVKEFVSIVFGSFGESSKFCNVFALRQHPIVRDASKRTIWLGKTVHGSSVFICGMCPMYSSNKGSLQTHQSTLHFMERHQCPACSKSFTRKGNMYNHCRLVHKFEPTLKYQN